jgi:glycosyltransferase involved in cell wall biosynthesis
MRKSDILVLPSIEEGFGLVITEAMGSGCVPLASDACTEICSHMKTGLMHHVGDVEALTQHVTMLHENRALLERLRAEGLEAAPGVTWTAAGRILLKAYRETISAHGAGAAPETGRAREATAIKA